MTERPDPADRMREVREAMDKANTHLAELVRQSDANGNRPTKENK